MKLILRYLASTTLLVLSACSNADVCNVIGYHHGNEFDGPTTCTPGTTDSINVFGTLTTTGTNFRGLVYVDGYVKSAGTNFSDGITVASNSIELDSTKASDIEMRHNGQEPQTVYLKQGSQVTSITFDNASATNKVCLSGGSEVVQVTGGKVIKDC